MTLTVVIVITEIGSDEAPHNSLFTLMMNYAYTGTVRHNANGYEVTTDAPGRLIPLLERSGIEPRNIYTRPAPQGGWGNTRPQHND